MIHFLHMAFPLTVHQCYCHCLCHAPTASQTLVMASAPSPFSDKHTGLLCHSVIQQAWERERESGEGNRSCASMHSFYLTSLWCETAQYSGFGAAAFPDQWRLNTLSWGPCSGMVEMQIFHAPEIKSFHYLLNPKENIFFLPFSPTGTQVPAWSDERERCTDPNACSTRVSAESLRRIYRLLKTFSGFNSLSQLSPKITPKAESMKTTHLWCHSSLISNIPSYPNDLTGRLPVKKTNITIFEIHRDWSIIPATSVPAVVSWWKSCVCLIHPSRPESFVVLLPCHLTSSPCFYKHNDSH